MRPLALGPPELDPHRKRASRTARRGHRFGRRNLPTITNPDSRLSWLDLARLGQLPDQSERQSAMQRILAARHLKDGHLVLYDITSSYFEGAYSQSDTVTFDRDGKRGDEQIVIALLCNAEGCPVGVDPSPDRRGL
jgi:hypothetical protein